MDEETLTPKKHVFIMCFSQYCCLCIIRAAGVASFPSIPIKRLFGVCVGAGKGAQFYWKKKKKRFHRAFCVTHTDWWIVSQSTAAAADRFLNNIDSDNDNLCTTAVNKYSPIYVS